ncbi:heterogeneous nuclear ribonucleoprotein L-like [Sipha flava]|uniref:Heterogeneous nuclear ribonucleoprotein L-like n=1 Tax=Sipha flava TaxID=143950 RepID=A0A8B8FAH8_9HEMI|nr:heterogeneous nuclear ribonucleoprotein L-like [Sipha flava]
MDRNQQQFRQRMSMNPASRQCTECRRHQVGRQMEAIAGRRSTTEYVSNDRDRRSRPYSVERDNRGYSKCNNYFRARDVRRYQRSSEVQRIGKKPESGSGDTSTPSFRRSSSSRTRGARPGRTLLVHGLEGDINCDKVFNMFCLYGNVTAVKILKKGQVLVELNDVEAAKRCVTHLHLMPLDQQKKLKVKYSNFSYIRDQKKAVRLSDGTPTQKYYDTSKLNRFSYKKKFVNERRIAAPSKILHFFNTPLDISGSQIRRAVINALSCKDAVRSITILPQKQSGAKCSTGLLELKSVDQAAKVILLLNHTQLESSRSKFPFLMKLCFSKWSEMRQKSGDSSALIFNATPPNTQWLFHSHEHCVSMVEYKVSRVTQAIDEDCLWTLWDMRNHATEAIDPEAGTSTDIHCRPSDESGTLQNPQTVLSGLPVDE